MDILNTTLKYVSPKHLTSFFIIHKLDFNIRFRFDARHDELTCDEINNICSMFKRIILGGLCIFLTETIFLNETAFCDILYLKICGEKYRHTSISTLINIFELCPKIITMCLFGIAFRDVDLINHTKCKTLKYLIFDDCTYVNNIMKHIIGNNIKYIKMIFININAFTCDSISKFPLRKLIFTTCYFCDLHSHLICNKLRFLEIVNGSDERLYGPFENKWNLNATLFKQCDKIRNLKLINCGIIKNFCLKDFKCLKYYDFKKTSFV